MISDKGNKAPAVLVPVPTLHPSTLNRLSLKDSLSFVSEIINKSTSSILKKKLLKIGKIQFAQYQLSDDVDKRWYSSVGRSIHLM